MQSCLFGCSVVYRIELLLTREMPRDVIGIDQNIICTYRFVFEQHILKNHIHLTRIVHRRNV